MMLTDDQLQGLYVWVDSIPLSRPKRNIARDFSDGVLIAEIIKHYQPRLVELHNYSSASGVSQKTYNWQTLNEKVFPKIGFRISNHDVQQVVLCKPGAIEQTLYNLRECISKYTAKKMNSSLDSTGRRRKKDDTFHQNSKQVNASSPAASPAQVRHRMQGPDSQKTLFGEGESNDRFRHTNQTIQRDASPVNRKANRNDIHGTNNEFKSGNEVSELLREKDDTIRDLRETVEILELKVQKLEQLVQLKDNKIAALVGSFSR